MPRYGGILLEDYRQQQSQSVVPEPEKQTEKKDTETIPTKEKTDWGRIGSQVLGGMVGGAVATPGAITTPAGIGLGSAIGGQIYDRVREYQGIKEPKPLLRQSIGAAEDVMFDVVSPSALKAGVYAIKKGGAYILSTPARKFAGSAERYFRQSGFGVKPTAASATQRKSLMVAENALSDYPLSSGPLQRSARYNIDQLKFANEYLAKEYGDILTKEEIGTLLRGGARQALDRLDGIYNKLFSKVAQQIGESPQTIDNTTETLQRLVQEAQLGPSSGVVGIAEEIFEKSQTTGGLPFAMLKKYRTKIGDMMKDPALISTRNIQSGDLKRLYGALTKDMEAAALAAGPKAHAAWRAANKYFQISITNKVPILEEIIRRGYSEDVYNILMRSSKLGGSRLRLIRRQMTKDAWETTSGTILGKLGIATPGSQTAAGTEFSISSYLTNWNRLAPQAKKALWGGTKYEELYKQLNQFAETVGDLKSIETIANKSKTGSVLMFFSLFSSLGGSVGYAAGGGMGALGAIATAGSITLAPNSIARLMTNQAFVKWLTQGVKVMKTNPNAMSVHLGRLFALKEKGNLDDEFGTVVKNLMSQ